MDYDQARQNVARLADAVRSGGVSDQHADAMAALAVVTAGHTLIDIAESLDIIAKALVRKQTGGAP